MRACQCSSPARSIESRTCCRVNAMVLSLLFTAVDRADWHQRYRPPTALRGLRGDCEPAGLRWALTRGVAAHDPLGAELLGRKHGEQADGAVADDCDGLAWAGLGGHGAEP